tara:strand:- start:265 stop:705 length:441 start_codon:yes stop_codon:yes gene_type:complete
MSLYEELPNDYYFAQGDAVTMGFEFFTPEGDPIDIRNYGCKFYLYDAVNKQEVVPMLDGIEDYTKRHDDTITNGAGVYFNGDDQIANVELTGIDEDYQAVVFLSTRWTNNLKPGVYRYVLKFEISTDNYWVPATGNLVIRGGSDGV